MVVQGSAIRAAALGLWEEAIDLYMASKHYSKAVDTLTEQLERNYSDWQKGHLCILLYLQHKIFTVPKVLLKPRAARLMTCWTTYFDANV